MKKLLLSGSVASMLALFFAACGDDVIHVHNDEYAIVESLDSLVCDESNDGEMALVKSTGVLYSCTNGEWSVVNASEAVDLRCKSEPLKDSTGYKILCDGQVIGTVYNGKDGKEGKQGTPGKQGGSGDDGKSGKEVNVDSVSKAVSKKVTDTVIDTLTEVLMDSLSCRIDTSWTDTKESLINVQIVCGSASSVIQLPTLVPNKNLTKHYKKHVIVRFPVQSEKLLTGSDFYSLIQGDYAEMWSNVKGSGFAELSVMEVDANFDQTGKSFVAELYASNDQPFVTVEEANANSVNYKVLRLEGDIDVTNLISSFAELRVNLELTYPVVRFFGMEFSDNPSTKKITYSAAVDLDDDGPVVIDFLTDYKAARVKALLKGKKPLPFAEASELANKQLVEAFHISNDPENYSALEHYVPSEVGYNEQFANTAWLMALLDQAGTPNYISVYAAYRASFAANGDFKTAIELPYNGKSRYMFLVDYLALLMKQNFVGYCFSEDGECDKTFEDTVDAMYNVSKYKVVQAAFREDYNLPEVKKDTVVKVSSGYFEYFVYASRANVWWPMELSLFADLSDYQYHYYVNSEYEDTEIIDRNHFVAQLSGTKCSKDADGEFYTVAFEEAEFLFKCKEDTAYHWTKIEGLVNALCDGKKAGDYGDAITQYGGHQYYRCDKSEKEGTGLIAVNVDEREYGVGKPCNSNSRDLLYTIPDSIYFFRCIVPALEDGTTAAGTEPREGWYVSLKPEYKDDLDTIIAMQVGKKCSDIKAVKTINLMPGSTAKVFCDSDSAWKRIWDVTDTMTCNVDVMKKHKVYHVDEEEWIHSTLTRYEYFKCECDTKDGAFDNCRWDYADDLDVMLNKACDASLQDSTAEQNGNEYACTGSNDGRSWFQLDANRDCPAIVAPDGGRPWETDEPCEFSCEYYGKTYYYSQKTEKWITLGSGETCLSIGDYCNQNKQDLEKTVCESRGESEDCVERIRIATVCLVKDAIHKETLMEEIRYLGDSATSVVFRTDEEICEAKVNGSNDASYQSENIEHYTDEGNYAVFLDGYTMNGVVLPEVFKVESTRAVQGYKCTRVDDVQSVCTALYNYLVSEFNYDESSCNNPCVYKGETYYYNFNEKVGDDKYGKWMTLAEMGLTQCPAMDDYCDAHNNLERACTTVDFCEETENAEGCMSYDEYDDWSCPEYPFTRMIMRCEDGSWHAGQA